MVSEHTFGTIPSSPIYRAQSPIADSTPPDCLLPTDLTFASIIHLGDA